MVPACILNSETVTLPFYEMAGLGPYNMNNFVMENEALSNSKVLHVLLIVLCTEHFFFESPLKSKTG